MELIRGRHNLQPHHRGCAVTIGAFDGVHLGHQSVLTHLRRGRVVELLTTVVTFEPLPANIFGLGSAPRITTLRDKWPLLAECGVDRVLCLPLRVAQAVECPRFVEEVFVSGLRRILLPSATIFGSVIDGR